MVAKGKWFEFDTASRYSFDELIERYIEYSKLNPHKRTFKNILTYMKQLLSEFSVYTLNQITPELISRYRDKRLLEGKAPQKVLHDLNFLNCAFNMAI